METSSVLKVLIVVIFLAMKHKLSLAHAQLQAETGSRSHVGVMIYEMIGDLYNLKHENKMMAETIQVMEENLESQKTVATNQAAKIDMLEEKLESQKTVATNQAAKIYMLEEKLESQKTVATNQAAKIDMLEEKLESQKTVATNQAAKIDMLEEKLESQKTVATNQAAKIDMLEENLDSQKTVAMNQAAKIDMLEEKLKTQENLIGRIEMIQEKMRTGKAWKCYYWNAEDYRLIRAGRPQQELCEKVQGRKFTQGNEIMAPGCGTCFCCQPTF